MDRDRWTAAGTRVKEETPGRIVLERWEGRLVDSPRGLIAYLPLVVALLALGLYEAFRHFRSDWGTLVGLILLTVSLYYLVRSQVTRKRVMDPKGLARVETLTLDFEKRTGVRDRQAPPGEAQQEILDLGDVRRVRVRLEEHGHHYQLHLERSQGEPFLVSVALFDHDYSPEALIAHGRKIGKLLGVPVIRQHTDTGVLLQEEVPLA